MLVGGFTITSFYCLVKFMGPKTILNEKKLVFCEDQKIKLPSSILVSIKNMDVLVVANSYDTIITNLREKVINILRVLLTLLCNLLCCCHPVWLL
jgi:hypothetical protein